MLNRARQAPKTKSKVVVKKVVLDEIISMKLKIRIQ